MVRVFKMYHFSYHGSNCFSLALKVAVCSSLNTKSLFAIHKHRNTLLLVDAISEMQIFEIICATALQGFVE